MLPTILKSFKNNMLSSCSCNSFLCNTLTIYNKISNWLKNFFFPFTSQKDKVGSIRSAATKKPKQTKKTVRYSKNFNVNSMNFVA